MELAPVQAAQELWELTVPPRSQESRRHHCCVLKPLVARGPGGDSMGPVLLKPINVFNVCKQNHQFHCTNTNIWDFLAPLGSSHFGAFLGLSRQP